MAFKVQEPPPIQREGRKAETLDEKEAKALFDQLSSKDDDGNYPWVIDTQDYKTKPMAQSKVLFYRRELHRLGHVEHPKQIQSRTVPADMAGGSKGAFRYYLHLRDVSAINEATNNGTGE